MSTDKQRWPWEQAFLVAGEIRAILMTEQAVDRIEIAGSIRRHKAQVGDIEILYIPRMGVEQNPDSFLPDEVPVNLFDRAIADLEKCGILARRKNTLGRESFGEKNKLMVHVASGIPVDLFAATAESWFNYLVCRTGGAENNVAIASSAQRKGWKWNPYGSGFSRVLMPSGKYQTVAVASEREVFEFVGLQYRDPKDRS